MPIATATTAQPSILGLRRVALLDGLPTSALEALAQQCAWRRYKPGQPILSREAADRDVYMIIAGRIRVTAFSAGGRQVTYGDRNAGDWFGELAAIDGRSRSADVVALEDSLLASMSPAVFQRLLSEYPAVCDRTLRRLAGLARELTDRVFDLSTLGVQNRVHAELLRLARQAGVASNAARIDPAPKHSDIASQVSTYREQVTRELSGLARQGLIERAGGALIVRDVARLERLVIEVRNEA